MQGLSTYNATVCVFCPLRATINVIKAMSPALLAAATLSEARRNLCQNKVDRPFKSLLKV